jgi:multimeric flavodoxin WrbA
MGNRILAFSASPRKGGNSDILLDRVIQGAASPDCDIEKIYLDDLSIRPCIACESCLKSIDTPCVIDDDMAPLIDKIKVADGIIFASPIYFCSVNAQMKLLLDRMTAVFDTNYDTLKGKKVVLVFTCAQEDPAKSGVRNAIQMFKDAFIQLEVDITGILDVPCYEKGIVAENEQALNTAFVLGRDLKDEIIKVKTNI